MAEEEAKSKQINQEEVVVKKSTVLNEEEVKATLEVKPEEGTKEEVKTELPSDQGVFEMPEKFVGKSQEDIAKAYMELEKMKDTKEEPPVVEEGKEVKEKAGDDISPLDNVTKENFDKYTDEFLAKGALNEDQYKELEVAGYTKQQVDDQLGYLQYQIDKRIDATLEPYGGKDEFAKAGTWARENWTEEQVNNLNDQLASSDSKVVDAVLTGLFSAYKSDSKEAVPGLEIHSQQQPKVEQTTGYKTKSDYLKDANDPRYDVDAAYRNQVGAKLVATDMEKWY